MSSVGQTSTIAARWSSVLANCLLGLVVMVIFACLVQQLLGMSMVFVLGALAAYLVGVAILLASVTRSRAPRCFGAANQVTLLRAVLVALLFGLVSQPATDSNAWLAAGIALLASALDGVDGWLARRLGLASAFGARFDMETDALLLVALALLVWQFDKAGYWVVLAGALRYLFLAAGGLLAWLRHPLPPSRRRQTVCVLQILSLIVCLLPVVARTWSETLAVVGLLLLTWSFAVDVVWLARQARPQTEEAR